MILALGLVGCERGSTAEPIAKTDPEPASTTDSATEPATGPGPTSSTPEAETNPPSEKPAAIEETGPVDLEVIEARVPTYVATAADARPRDMAEVRWAKDSTFYVAKAHYGWGDTGPDDGETHDLTPHQVWVWELRDRWTDRVLERYLVASELDPDHEAYGGAALRRAKRVASFARTSQSAKAWVEREASLDMAPSRPTATHADWRLSVELESGQRGAEIKPIAEGLLVVDTEGRGEWGPKGARFEVLLEGPSRHAMLQSRALLARAENYRVLEVHTLVSGFWSPDGRRVLLRAVDTVEHGGRSDFMVKVRQRWYPRAVGPQVKVVAAGSGEARARKVATALESRGITVTTLDPDGETAEAAEIYWRGDAEPTARAIAETLGAGWTVHALNDEGWVDVIVLVPPA